MKTFMSIAIAVALTLLIVPAMADVSTGAQKSIGLAEKLHELADAVQNVDMNAVELEVEVQFEPSGPDDPVPSVETTVRCRGVAYGGIRDLLEAEGWNCNINLFGTLVCRN